MNPDPTSSAQPSLRPAPGREKPLKEYATTTDRGALPTYLDWASDSLRPPINGRVSVISFGIALGAGTVVGYFYRNNKRGGELGLLVELDRAPAGRDLPAGTRSAHFYGEDITRLDQGDEPVESEPVESEAPTAKAEAEPETGPGTEPETEPETDDAFVVA